MPITDELQTALTLLGISLPSKVYIVGAILFGILGMIAYYRGVRQSRKPVQYIGLGLMLYPYVIHDDVLLYVVGSALCLAWYGWRK